MHRHSASRTWPQTTAITVQQLCGTQQEYTGCAKFNRSQAALSVLSVLLATAEHLHATLSYMKAAVPCKCLLSFLSTAEWESHYEMP